jgi:hypothetical protein
MYRPFQNKYKKNFTNMSFEQFAEFVSRVPDARANGHFRSQHTFIGKQLPHLNFIGHFENFDKDLAIVKHALHINYKHKHLWKSKGRKPYKKYYTKKTKNLIAKRFEADIRLFNYTF